MRNKTATTVRRTKRRTGRRSPLATVALLAHRPASPAAPTRRFTQRRASGRDVQRPRRPRSRRARSSSRRTAPPATASSAQGTEDGPSLYRRRRSRPSTSRSAPAACRCRCRARRRSRSRVQFTDEQINALAAYVASLGPGPDIPADERRQRRGRRRQRRRALPHQLRHVPQRRRRRRRAHRGQVRARADGRLARAHLRGHGHRPAEHAGLQRPEPHPRRQARHHHATCSTCRTTASPGGFELGSLGPVSEGLFIWIFGLGAIVAITVWITAKSN